MKFRYQRNLIPALLTLVWLVTGCDERNKADVPVDIFTLSAAYSTASVINHVSADGDYIAIAASVAGMRVLDVRDLGNITVAYSYETPTAVGSQWVALNSEIGIIANFLDAPDPFLGTAPIFRFHADGSPGDTIGGVGFSGPLSDLIIETDLASSPQTFTMWAGDRCCSDGLVGSRYCRDNAEDNWGVAGCVFQPPPYVPARDNIRGMDKQGDLIAIAVDEDGIHIEDVSVNSSLSDLNTPGVAYDCAWLGDYIFIADRFDVTVIDASDPSNPEIIASLIIDGADRLSQVAVIGDYACLLDDFDGVYIVNVADPSNPELVQKISLAEPSSLDTDGNRLYVTDEQQGLLIYTLN